MFPADKAVGIVDEEGEETNADGEIGGIGEGCKNPHRYQHYVVGGVCQSEIRTAPIGEVDGEEAGGYGKSAKRQIGRTQPFQKEIKQYGNQSGERAGEYPFLFGDLLYGYLRFVALIGVFQPRNQGHNRHGYGHADRGNHFPVIGKAVGNVAV